MYSDSLCVASPSFLTRKIFRIRNSLLGVAGDTNACLKFLRWFETQGDDTLDGDDADWDVLELNKEGIFVWGGACAPLVIAAPYHGVGSGAEYALGAMDAGSHPGAAMEIACRRDHNSRPPIVYVAL